MAEYIEREELLRTPADILNWGDPYGYSISAIKQFPAADVAPVRHGRWEQHLLPLAWKCSVCRYNTSNRALKYNHMNYCPNCGAKMDGEEKP